MKPYAVPPNELIDAGCCPGHDWPRLYRWSGRYSSKHSKITDAKRNRQAKRIRRHRDKQELREEFYGDSG